MKHVDFMQAHYHERNDEMITNVTCDRCHKSIEPDENGGRFGYLEVASPGDMIHMGAHGDGYAETFAYIDLCPDCTAKFHEWMKAEREE